MHNVLLDKMMHIDIVKFVHTLLLENLMAGKHVI